VVGLGQRSPFRKSWNGYG